MTARLRFSRTSLRNSPHSHHGYPPAREAFEQSERALHRATLIACCAAVAAYGGAFALRGLWVAPPPSILELPAPPEHVLRVLVERAEPARPHFLPAGTLFERLAVPVPVPDVVAPPAPAAAEARSSEATSSAPVGNPSEGTREPEADPEPPPPGDLQPYDEPPQVAVQERPPYPQLAIDAGVEGTVLLWVRVNRDGTVGAVRVARSVPLLDEAAKSAAMRWRFTPALANGHPIRVWVAVPVRFRLH